MEKSETKRTSILNVNRCGLFDYKSLTICRLCLAAGDDDGDDSKEGGRGGLGRAMGRNDGFDYPEEGKGEEGTGEG